MRKLLITAAAGAGLLMTTVAANAATPAGTYTHSQGAYTLCVTNNVVDSGATQMIQVDLGGLPKQPGSLTSPIGWNASSSSVAGLWTISWTTMGSGLNNGVQLCGFGFKDHGRQITAILPLTITEMTPSGTFFETLTSTATRI
ncbi:MAG TPA: hypothetical protein VET82_01370 [Candidatus Eisenbacteria bacterium]|nr:hypothetical protein [Candidatus Eisenbacteria bacterium]